MLFDAPLTFREFMAHEEVPLATLFREVLSELAGRDDVALFGAQAVNAYCEPARMTADLDVLSTRAEELIEALKQHLATRFHLALRVREVANGAGYRLYQVRKPKNRHLVDVRQVAELPPSQRIEGVAVAMPAELVAMKVLSIQARQGREKELSDRLDAVRLLRTFPDLKSEAGPVSERLRELHAPPQALAVWRELVSQQVEPDDDDDY
ncbi:MAG TPA: hypothetical protein VJT73_06630 [Polyangiaceae bacterium]|nr:hypothetical protein [Polyangiaceae bacterium]